MRDTADIVKDDTAATHLGTCLALDQAITVHRRTVYEAMVNLLPLQAIIQTEISTSPALKQVAPPNVHDTTDTSDSRAIVVDFKSPLHTPTAATMSHHVLVHHHQLSPIGTSLPPAHPAVGIVPSTDHLVCGVYRLRNARSRPGCGDGPLGFNPTRRPWSRPTLFIDGTFTANVDAYELLTLMGVAYQRMYPLAYVIIEAGRDEGSKRAVALRSIKSHDIASCPPCRRLPGARLSNSKRLMSSNAIATLFLDERFAVPKDLVTIQNQQMRSLMVHRGDRFDVVQKQNMALHHRVEAMDRRIDSLNGKVSDIRTHRSSACSSTR